VHFLSKGSSIEQATSRMWRLEQQAECNSSMLGD